MDLLAAIPTGTVSRDDYVRTPAGFVHRTCVHTVAAGEVVDVDGDILQADGSRRTIARCTRPLLRDLEPGDDDEGGSTNGAQSDIQFVRFTAALVDHALRTSLEGELSYAADGQDGRWSARAGYLYPSDPPATTGARPSRSSIPPTASRSPWTTWSERRAAGPMARASVCSPSRWPAGRRWPSGPTSTRRSGGHGEG